MSINQYSYCWNNPLLYVDPSGHYPGLDYEQLAAELNVPIKDNSPWKDIVDIKLEEAVKNSVNTSVNNDDSSFTISVSIAGILVVGLVLQVQLVEQ